MDDCIFCKILSGEIPSAKVYEDDHVYAFLDIAPVNPGHTLVIPKRHAKQLTDTSDEDLTYVILAAKKIGKALLQTNLAVALNIAFNNGPEAGQVVHHTHAHVIPRKQGDGLKTWPQGSYSEGEAEKIAADIRAEL